MDRTLWTAIFCDVMRTSGAAYEPARLAAIADDMFRSVGRTVDPTVAAKVINARSYGALSIAKRMALNVE